MVNRDRHSDLSINADITNYKDKIGILMLAKLFVTLESLRILPDEDKLHHKYKRISLERNLKFYGDYQDLSKYKYLSKHAYMRSHYGN